MSKESFILLPLTNTAGAFVGEKHKGPGYNRRSDGLTTIVTQFNNWSGALRFQGTLEIFPNNTTDWTDLLDGNRVLISYGGDSSDYDDAYSANVIGNFVWIRAIGTVTTGAITEIRYNY